MPVQAMFYFLGTRGYALMRLSSCTDEFPAPTPACLCWPRIHGQGRCIFSSLGRVSVKLTFLDTTGTGARYTKQNEQHLWPSQPTSRIHIYAKQWMTAHSATAYILNAAHKEDTLADGEHHLLYPCVCPHLLGKCVER